MMSIAHPAAARTIDFAPCLRCGSPTPMTLGELETTVDLRTVRGVAVLRVLCGECTARNRVGRFPVPEDFPAPKPGEKHGAEYLAAIQAHLDHYRERERLDAKLFRRHWRTRVLPALRAMLEAAEEAG